MPEFTDTQRQDIRRMQAGFPYRIIYAAINPTTEEFFTSAVDTMKIPNRLKREGWNVWIITSAKNITEELEQFELVEFTFADISPTPRRMEKYSG